MSSRLRAVAIVSLVIATGVFAADGQRAMTLGDCVQSALQHSPRLAESLATSRAVEGRVGQARAPLGLQTALDGRYSDSDPAPQNLQKYAATLSVSKLLYDSGKTGARVAQAQQLLQASRYAVRQTELEVALSTAQGYYQVLKSKQLQGVAAEVLKSAEYHRELAAAAYAAGTMPRADVIRSEVDVARQRLSQIAAETATETALAQLINVMGLEPGTALQVQEPSRTISPPVELDVALQTAYARRPESEQAKAETGAGQAAVRAAQTGLKPQVSAGANWGYFDNASTGGDTGWSLGLSLSVPLSDGGDTRSRVGEARSLVEALQARQETVRQRVALEVTSALSALRGALEGIAVAKEELRLARHNMELAEGRYRVGVGRLIEVTDARTALSTALTDEVTAAYDYQVSRADVARAMGLLPTEAIPAHE
jgi:outer membrane protein TolC